MRIEGAGLEFQVIWRKHEKMAAAKDKGKLGQAEKFL